MRKSSGSKASTNKKQNNNDVEDQKPNEDKAKKQCTQCPICSKYHAGEYLCKNKWKTWKCARTAK
jgi:hypothetical protein